MIEFQFFKGCPGSAVTLDNINQLIKEGFINETSFNIIEIKNLEDAEENMFQGSPSVLYKGVDIFTGEIPSQFSYSCRVYQIDGKLTGVLSKEFLKNRLSALQNNIA